MKKSLIFSVALVFCALLLLWFGLNAGASWSGWDFGPIVLLVEDDTGAFLMQVKQGAQKAAQEAGTTLSVETVSAGSLEQAAARWADRNAGAALLLLEDPELSKTARELFKGKGFPVVAIVTREEEETDVPQVGMNERHAGWMMGTFADFFDTVYVFGDAPTRLKGIKERLTMDQAVYTEGELPKDGEFACVIALTGDETLRLAGLKKEGGFTAMFVGADPGEERVELMESGLTDALICQTPYAMGYTAAAAALNGWETGQLLAYRVVMPQNMYSAEKVKLMFPLLN